MIYSFIFLLQKQQQQQNTFKKKMYHERFLSLEALKSLLSKSRGFMFLLFKTCSVSILSCYFRARKQRNARNRYTARNRYPALKNLARWLTYIRAK